MTKANLKTIALNTAETILHVAPGRFYNMRVQLRVLVVCIATTVLFCVLEVVLGLSVFGLPPQRDQSAAASLLLVVSPAVVCSSVLILLSSVLDRPAATNSAKHTEPGGEEAPAWWAAAILTALAVGLGVVACGALYATDQWVFKGRNLFVANEISSISFLAVVVGVCIGVPVAVFAGAARLAQLAEAASYAYTPWIRALRMAAQWVFVAAILMFLLTSLSSGARSVLSSFGVKAEVTSAMAIAAILFSTCFASLGLSLMWVEQREQDRVGTAAWQRQDFWHIDLRPETSMIGMAASGYPFYLWRESADSRFGLSRPRFCTITDDGPTLNFVFFDPSKDQQPTWAPVVGVSVAVFVVLVLTFAAPSDRGSLSFTGTAVWAMLLGVFAGVAWHLGLTVLRWKVHRFKNDGRLITKPLKLLSGFSKEHAGELGAKIHGEEAKTGHGLAATFDDGSMLILTGNAWNFRSIVEHHGDLTTAFRIPRDAYVAEWEAKQKEKERTQSAAASPDRPVIGAGVPDLL